MVYIGKPPLDASSVGNAKNLATNSYKKLISKVLGPLVIDSVQPNTLKVDDHDIHNTVSSNLATSAPGTKQPPNSSQHFLFEKDPSMDLDASG